MQNTQTRKKTVKKSDFGSFFLSINVIKTEKQTVQGQGQFTVGKGN